MYRYLESMVKNEKLGVFDCTMIVVSLVIGMGIFRTPVNVAQHVPDNFLFFFTWIAGGLIALCGALTYAEIGSRLPVTGGYYKIFSYGYHPSIAFAINCIILISNAASLAGVALIGAEYISGVLFPNIIEADALQMREIAIALFSILVFYGVNLLGLKMSARAQNVLTIIKISLIVLLVTPLFFSEAGKSINSSHVHISRMAGLFKRIWRRINCSFLYLRGVSADDQFWFGCCATRKEYSACDLYGNFDYYCFVHEHQFCICACYWFGRTTEFKRDCLCNGSACIRGCCRKNPFYITFFISVSLCQCIADE